MLKRAVFILSFFLFYGSNAELIDHLKKAEGKGIKHHMRNIDFIYMINLDERPEKWEMSRLRLEPYGIYPYRFSAINGWKLSLEDINDVGVKYKIGMQPLMAAFYPFEAQGKPVYEPMQTIDRTYFGYRVFPGAIGCSLSHLSVLQDALNSGYDTIWILEDDIEVISDPREVSNLIDKLDGLVGKDNWDVLFTDKDAKDPNGNYVPALGMSPKPNFEPLNKTQYYVKRQVSCDFWQIGARFGSYSMIIRRSGMQKIFNFITSYKIFLPYDMDYYLPFGIKLYTVVKDLVSNFPQAASDNCNAPN